MGVPVLVGFQKQPCVVDAVAAGAHGAMPIAPCNAPCTACSASLSFRKPGGALADSTQLRRCAISRGVPETAGAIARSTPLSAARSHRRNVRHPRAPHVPTIRQGLTRRRTSRLGRRSIPYWAIAQTTATNEKSRYRSPSGGPTLTTARHRRHRYRRTQYSSSCGGDPGLSGPRICRRRTPCPTSVSFRPGSPLAAPQQGHWLGLTAATSGILFVQNLSSSRVCISLVPLTSCGAWRGDRPSKSSSSPL